MIRFTVNLAKKENSYEGSFELYFADPAQFEKFSAKYGAAPEYPQSTVFEGEFSPVEIEEILKDATGVDCYLRWNTEKVRGIYDIVVFDYQWVTDSVDPEFAVGKYGRYSALEIGSKVKPVGRKNFMDFTEAYDEVVDRVKDEIRSGIYNAQIPFVGNTVVSAYEWLKEMT